MSRTNGSRAGKEFRLRSVWNAVYAKMEEQLPEQAMREWMDHFHLAKLGRGRAVIDVDNDVDLEMFLWQYEEALQQSLREVLPYEVRVRFQQDTARRKRRRGAARKAVLALLSVLLLGAAAVVVVLGVSVAQNQSFRETFYQVSSGKVDGGLRIIQISDLHGTEYGDGNEALLERVERLAPDLVVLTGDGVDKNDADASVTVDLCERLAGIAPVCYVYGNHECARVYGNLMTRDSLDEALGMGDGTRDDAALREWEDPLREELEAAGVFVLLNEELTLELNGTAVDVYGTLTSNPSAFWPYAGGSFSEFLLEDPENFKLFLCHEPYLFTALPDDAWGDLALCGHTHGGVVRLPYVGGVYELEWGLFPELFQSGMVYGRYTAGATPVIVSGGMTNRGALRINNRPELVIVDVSRY